MIIENAFLEAFRLLADSFDDVLQSVLNTIEDILKDDTELKRVKQLEKDISTIESKKSRLTDLLIDGKIEQKDYDEKKLSFQRKLHQITEEKAYLEENIGQQKNSGWGNVFPRRCRHMWRQWCHFVVNKCF